MIKLTTDKMQTLLKRFLKIQKLGYDTFFDFSGHVNMLRMVVINGKYGKKGTRQIYKKEIWFNADFTDMEEEDYLKTISDLEEILKDARGKK
jgi:hypothetical protein